MFCNLLCLHREEIFPIEQKAHMGNGVNLFRIGRIDAQHL